MIETAETICRFWLKECGPDAWYSGGGELDTRIRDRFEPSWQAAMDGRLVRWTNSPRGSLGYLILTDQFPRNMFRGTPRAFASDRLALCAAKRAIRDGFDREVEGAARQFFYMPLEHSELGPDQHRAVRLFASRTASDDLLLHARAHREIIRRYGRFPYRNEALGRTSTASERAMLEDGAYGGVLRELQAAA